MLPIGGFSFLFFFMWGMGEMEETDFPVTAALLPQNWTWKVYMKLYV
jgi:hypothetical protein